MSLQHRYGAAGLCSKCQAEVTWVQLERGKTMPIDPVPSLAGTVAVMRDAHGVLRGRVVTKDSPVMAYERLHVTHFATCAPTIAARQAVKDGSVIDLAKARARRRGQRSLF